jgi:uncharacterized repeat protein (TIGR01451 family)
MVVPLPCGKLQPARGLGAKTQAASRRGAALRTGLVIMFFSCAAGSATGDQDGAVPAPRDLIVSSTLERIVGPNADDASALRIASDTVASHADQLIVSVRFTNSSGHVIDSVRITSPVPADVQYVPNSASGPGSEVLFSVDNGRSFGRPGELTFSAADGSVRNADPAEYTHVRWVLRAPLDAGATGIARYRAVPR